MDDEHDDFGDSPDDFGDSPDDITDAPDDFSEAQSGEPVYEPLPPPVPPVGSTDRFATTAYEPPLTDEFDRTITAEPEEKKKREWWVIPALLLPVLVGLALLGTAIDNSDDDVSTSATTVTTAASATTSSINFTTQTTVRFTTSTTPSVTTSTLYAGPPPFSATTVKPTGTTAAATSNAVMTIEANWSPNPGAAGQPVTFNVTARDPDAGPITACGGTPSFGDGGTAPSCQANCSAPGARGASSQSFTYSHTYAQPGVYTVRLAYQSAGGCTSTTSGASQRTLEFSITIN